MKKLNKLLLKSFAGPLVATFFIALFILILQFLWQRIDDMAGKGLEGHIIAELLSYASAGLVPTALPLAILLSSIMTFGNLGENFELTAIKSSGISLQKFMKPLIYINIIFAVGMFFYSNYVIPYTNLKAMSLIYDIKKQREELSIREGVFYNDIEGYSLKVSEKNPKTKLMKNIMIYNHSDNEGNVQVTIADSGYFRMTNDETKLMVTLFKGQTYQEMEEKRGSRKARRNPEYPHQITKFDKQTLLIDLKGFDFTRTDESLFSDNYQMLNISQLNENEDSLIKDYNKSLKTFSNRVSKNFYVGKTIIKRTQDSRKNKTDNPDRRNHSRKPKKDESVTEEPVTKSKSRQLPDSVHLSENKDSLQKDSSAQSDSLLTDTLASSEESRGPAKLDIKATFDTIDPYAKVEILGKALNYARRNSKQISNSRARFEHKQTKIYKHQIEWHKKFTLSFACIIFFFIGAPLGSIIRKGGLGTPLVISVLLFITYYIISMTGENIAERGGIPAYIGMWISSFIFLPIGIFLTYKATNDSVMFNTNTYIKAIQNVLSFRFKSGKQQKKKQQGNE